MSTPQTKTERNTEIQTVPTATPTRAAVKAVTVPSKIPPGTCFKSIVTVQVGPEKQAFAIHKDLLCFYSDYYRAAFSGSFQEASDGNIFLPTESINVFNVFNTFIYTRQICPKEEESKLNWVDLCRCWVFGDKHIAPSFQNAIMDAMARKCIQENIIPTYTLRYIYQNTLSGSPLRRKLIDLVAYEANIDKFLAPDQLYRWPYEALVELSKSFYHRELISGRRLPERSKCHYHVHGQGEKCE